MLRKEVLRAAALAGYPTQGLMDDLGFWPDLNGHVEFDEDIPITQPMRGKDPAA
jgi:hypothetical protein